QATGSTIWSRAIGTAGTLLGLAYDRGQVFSFDTGGNLTAFDAATGAVAWSGPIGGYAYSAAPSATNGIVYLSGSNHVFAVRESDGHLLWTQPVAGGDHSSPAVTAHGVYVSYACQQA